MEIEAPESLLGALRCLAWETGDIVSPALPSSAWEALGRGAERTRGAQAPAAQNGLAPAAMILLDTHVVNKIATRARLAVLEITPEIAVLAAQFHAVFRAIPSTG